MDYWSSGVGLAPTYGEVVPGYLDTWIPGYLVSWHLDTRYDNLTWLWVALHPSSPSFLASSPTALGGGQAWTLHNDSRSCSLTSPYTSLLSLTGCSRAEAMCGDWSCVALAAWCDTRLDCRDRTDEAECSILMPDPGYDQDMVPVVEGTMEKLAVNMSINIKNILRIDEVGKSITIQFQLVRHWLDSRLVYQHLKDDADLNNLSEADQAMLWFPWTEFVNIESEEAETFRPQQTEFKVVKDPNMSFSLTDLTYLQNKRLYEGSHHLLSLTKEYTVVWMCNFHMAWYPFDTQTCTMQFEILNKFSKAAQLVPNKLEFISGEDSLSQYFIRESSMCYYSSPGRKEGVVVTISLTRLPYSDILTTFLPSTMLFILSHLANTWEEESTEMVVEVNLTILLVLATM